MTTSTDIRVRGICHDVRQPVAAILAMIAAARQEQEQSEGMSRWLDAIEAQATWISELARSGLRPQAGDAGDEEDADVAHDGSLVDLHGVVEQVTSTVARGSGVDVEVRADGGPVMIRGDRMQLSRALLNLLDNAVRAAGPDGRVEVRLSSAGGLAAVEVDDDGPGFARIPSGSGLGLRIARRAVSSCGGRMRIAASSRGGACVSMLLPSVALIPQQRVAR